MMPKVVPPSFLRRRWWALPLAALLAFGATVTVPAQVAYADDDMEEVDDEELADDEIADDDPSAVIIFRDRLSPHGTWMDHPDYGTVWVPSSKVVGADFAPYVSNGSWELTSDGDWLWVSDYDWGYIPFHYGRWVWVDDLGWSWIPGRVYAPAWVVWRTGADGYIGWAPAPPTYYWVDGYSYAWWGTPVAAYVFCPTTHVFHHHVHTVVIHDHHTVSAAVKGTRPYVSARPSKSGHTAAKPSAKHASAARIGKGPSLDDAGIKKSDAPKKFGSHDAKAKDFMKPDNIAKSKQLSKAAKSAAGAKAAPVAAKTPAGKQTKAAGVTGFTAPTRTAPSKATRQASDEKPSRSNRTVEAWGNDSPSPKKRSLPKSGGNGESSSAPVTRAPRGGSSFDSDSTTQKSVPRTTNPRSQAPRTQTPRTKAPRSHAPRSSSSGEHQGSSARSSRGSAPSTSRPSISGSGRASGPQVSAPSQSAPKPSGGGGARRGGGGRSGGKRR